MNSPVFLVTGAARRVGAEISRALHGAGARVAIHYRHSEEAAQALAAELNAIRPASAQVFAANLLAVETMPALVAAIVEHYGRLDGLINNASSFFATPLGAIDTEVWDELLGSNLKAPMFLAQAAAAHLTAARGCIINITDIHAERPLEGYAVYSAAKGGLLTLTRALAIELAPAVRVNAVAPGAIQWPDNSTDFSAEDQAEIIRHTLLKRVGSPADIARTVRFLAFDAPYITGQVINVDGGRTAHL